jgi:hypothetical protein
MSGFDSQRYQISREVMGLQRGPLSLVSTIDRLSGLVVRVPGYRSRSPGSIPGADFLRSNGSATGSTQPREYIWVATWKKK